MLCDARPGSEREKEEREARGSTTGIRIPVPNRYPDHGSGTESRGAEEGWVAVARQDSSGRHHRRRCAIPSYLRASLLFYSFFPSHFPPPSPSIAHDNTTEPMQRNATGYYCTYMYVLHACMHACMDLHIRPHTNLFSTSLLGRLCGRRDRSVDLRIQPQMHAWPARAAAAAAATLLQGLSSDCPDREEARPADREVQPAARGHH